MKSQVLVLLAFGALVSACGGGSTPVADAGTGAGGGGGGDPQTALCLDNDGDGVPGTGECSGEPLIDCNDHDPKVFPGAAEVCDGIDQNCNAQVDEGLTVISYYRDSDGDGFG